MRKAPLNSTEVDWTKEPNYRFESEIQALDTLTALGDDLRSARRQVVEIMRYLRAAVAAARVPDENGERTTPTAIIGHSGLSRRTVYQILDIKD